MLVAVRDDATTLVGVVGACVSAHAAVEPVTDACGELLPAASSASTAKVYAVPQLRLDTVVPGCVVVTFKDPLTYSR